MNVRVLLFACALAGCAGSSTQRPPQNPDALLPDGPQAPAGSDTVKEGERLLQEGELAEAKAAFERAVADSPNDARAHFDLGLAHDMLGEGDAAAEAYRKALGLDPKLSEARNNLALLLRERGELQEAVTLLREAVDQDPASAKAHANLALALEDSGDLGAAQASYEEALRLDPGALMTRVNYGLLLARKGEREAAAEQLLQAKSEASGNRAALAAIGPGLRMVGQPVPAVEALNAALSAGDGQPTPALLSELGLALRAGGDREAGKEALRRALKLDSKYATAHYLLGNMCAGDEQFGEAVKHYEAYLRLAPNGPQAGRAKERLQMARKLQKK